MKHPRLFAALAILCVLAGSAYALEKLMPAVIYKNKCTGCGTCVEECPKGAITLNDEGIASVNKDKCTGCKKCVKACLNEAIKMENSSESK